MTFFTLYLSLIFELGVEVYFILLALGIPTYFFWRWIFRKYLKTGKSTKIATWVATLITTPVLYLLVIQLFILALFYTPSRDFNKKQWLTDRESRFEMADDILESKLLIDRDSNQVKEILGEPNRNIETWQNNRDKLTWTYDMGMGVGGLGFLFHNLSVEFKNDKVINVTHIEIQD